MISSTEKALRHSLSLVRATLESTADGLLVVSRVGQIVGYNQRFLEMWKLPSALVASHDDEKVLAFVLEQLADPQAFLSKVMELYNQPDRESFDELRFKDGQIFERYSRPQRIEDEVIGRVWSFRDVTQSRRQQAELDKHRHHLEQLVQARTQELQDALTKLQAAQQHLVESEKMAALGRLVAGIAHEINTPVGTSVSAASWLEQEARQIESLAQSGAMTRSAFQRFLANATESSGLILSNLERAAHLIQSFKQVAVDQSHEEQRVFSLKSYLEEVLLSLKPHLQRTPHRLHLVCDGALMIKSYPGAYAQVITNLLLNSLRHAYEEDQQGRITISAKLINGEKHSFQLLYQDDGKGIAEEHRPYIFDPFFTTSRKHGGSGLGLHIVYNLVTQKLKGTIACESTPNQGVRFLLTLPLAEPPQNEAL